MLPLLLFTVLLQYPSLTEHKYSRVPERHGVSAPVYEAWTVYQSGSVVSIERTSFCGLNITKRSLEKRPIVSCANQCFDQDELYETTEVAVARYQRASRRSLPERMIRGRARSYEDDLDERIQKLPRPVQSELNALLGDRETASSNRFHRRDWTVVVMQEEYHYRFANAELKLAPKPRFWKRKEAQRPKQYFFVIRGSEGRVAVEDKGMCRARRHGNPWKRVDATEQSQKRQARVARRLGKAHGDDGCSGQQPASSIRSMSPPPSRRASVEHDDPAEDHPAPNPSLPGLPSDGRSAMHPDAPPNPAPPNPAPLASRPAFRTGPSPMRSMYSSPRDCDSAPPVGVCDLPSMYTGPPPPILNLLGPPFNFPHIGMPRVLYPPLPPTPSQSQLNDLPTRWSMEAQSPRTPREPVHPVDSDRAGHISHSRLGPIREDTGSSRRPSPPTAPRLSNLTTPTTFSPATTNRTGSSSDPAKTPIPANTGSREAFPESAPNFSEGEEEASDVFLPPGSLSLMMS